MIKTKNVSYIKDNDAEKKFYEKKRKQVLMQVKLKMKSQIYKMINIMLKTWEKNTVNFL